MPSPQSPPFNEAIEEFQTFVSQRCQQGSFGALPEQPETDCAPPRYLPDPDREEFFRDVERLKRLLDVVLRPEDRHRVRLDAVHQSYTRVFSTLLCIGRGAAITFFVNRPGFTDEHLPFTNRNSFPNTFSDETFFDDFCKRQWMFCAPKLDFQEWWQWESERILPVVYGEELGRGGSAKTFLLKVHPGHNNLHREPRKDGDDLYDTFVVKAFRPRDFEQSENEMHLFVRTRNNLHKTTKDVKDDCIIGFYGSYRHGNAFHIILEYANEGTLEDFFQKVAPPANPHDIYVLWRNMLQLLCALTALHNVGREDTEGYFCHYDIKPQNILVSSRMKESAYDYRFMLCDFGESRFRIKLGIELKGRAAPGTFTYGAPELYDPDARATLPILQAGPEVDIWSLGGVLSEVATWVGRGKDGLGLYRNTRMSCHEYPDLKHSGCFHDGVDVLQSVTGHHNDLLNTLLKGDSITEQVLTLVTHMLTRAQDRLDARALRLLAKRALEKSGGMLGNPERDLSIQSVSHSKSQSVKEVSQSNLIDDSSGAQPPSTLSAPPPPNGQALQIGTTSSHRHSSERTSVGTTSSAQIDPLHQSSTSTHRSSLHSPVPEIPQHATPTQYREELPAQGTQSQFMGPHWTLSEIRQLRQRQQPLPERTKDLEDRHYLFLLDNSSSMSAHWDNVLKLLEPMAYMVKRYDNHGIKLRFTCGGSSRKFKNTKPLMKEARKYSPQTPIRDRQQLTDIRTSLGTELENYRERLEKAARRRWNLARDVKKMVIYVFTDGCWQPSSNIKRHIKDLVATLDKHGKSSKQFGIQFIQFGNDIPARKSLEDYDGHLNLSRNIVDIEPFLNDDKKDNLGKMFLGSILKATHHTGEQQCNSTARRPASPTGTGTSLVFGH